MLFRCSATWLKKCPSWIWFRQGQFTLKCHQSENRCLFATFLFEHYSVECSNHGIMTIALDPYTGNLWNYIVLNDQPRGTIYHQFGTKPDLRIPRQHWTMDLPLSVNYCNNSDWKLITRYCSSSADTTGAKVEENCMHCAKNRILLRIRR